MPPVGFEHTIPAGEGPQTHALDRAATGTGYINKSIYLDMICQYHIQMNVKFDAVRPGTKPETLQSEPSKYIQFKHEDFATQRSSRVTLKGDVTDDDSNDTLRP
jgi:hypothetical protein